MQEVAVVLVPAPALRPIGLGLVELQRRNADLLAGLEPLVRLGAAAVDAQLALADDALDMREGELREARDQEPVDPHVRSRPARPRRVCTPVASVSCASPLWPWCGAASGRRRLGRGAGAASAGGGLAGARLARFCAAPRRSCRVPPGLARGLALGRSSAGRASSPGLTARAVGRTAFVTLRGSESPAACPSVPPLAPPRPEPLCVIRRSVTDPAGRQSTERAKAQIGQSAYPASARTSARPSDEARRCDRMTDAAT